MAPVLDLDVTPRAIALAGQMADLATRMWHRAADAWHDRDPTAATALADQNQHMGQLHAGITDELTTGNMAQHATLEMALIARCYQRLGAHAANIARRIAYLAGPPAH